MEKIIYYLLTKTNKDCFKLIHSFMYPSKEQIINWKNIHIKKSICKHSICLNYSYRDKKIYLYKCYCNNNYISIIKKVGEYYIYFKTYNYFKILLKHNNHYRSFFHYMNYQKYI